MFMMLIAQALNSTLAEASHENPQLKQDYWTRGKAHSVDLCTTSAVAPWVLTSAQGRRWLQSGSAR